MIDPKSRGRGRTTLSEREREKGDLLIKLTTYLNHHWNPTIYTTTVHNGDVMFMRFVDRVDENDEKLAQAEWFIEKLGAYLDVDADTANQTFKEVTTRTMSEIGFNPDQYLYTLSSPEMTQQIKSDFLERIHAYDNSHSISLKVYFVAALLDIDTTKAYTMLKWVEC